MSSVPDSQHDDGGRPEGVKPAETQNERAERALAAIFAGGDLPAEAMALSNEFTDRQTARLSQWLRRVMRRG